MTSTIPGGSETVFTYGAPLLKFGTGASDEIGYDLSQYGARRVLVVTDPRIAATGLAARVADQMQRFGIEAHVYDGVHVEPTDASLQQAIDHATEHGPWDAYVAVGGGSSIDTAKAVNLLTTNINHVWRAGNEPSTPAALAVRVAGSVRVALGPDGVGASVTRPAPSRARPVLSTPGPPAGGGPPER